MAKKYFTGDKISGLVGGLYHTSMVLEIFNGWNQRGLPFQFRFYGLNFNLPKHRIKEFVRNDVYEAEVDKLLAHLHRYGLGYFVKLRQAITREAKILRPYSRALIAGLPTQSDRALATTYRAFMRRYIYAFSLGVVTFLYEHIVSERLAKSLANREVDPARVLAQQMRSPYQSFMTLAHNQLATINRARTRSDRVRQAQQFAHDYFFIASSYVYTPPLEVSAVLRNAARLRHDRANRSDLRRQQKPRVRLQADERLLIQLLKQTEVIRDQRKLVNLICGYTMYRFLDELVRRTGITRAVAERMFWYEFPTLLRRPAHARRLRGRRSASIILESGRKHYLAYAAVRERWSGKLVGATQQGVPAAAGQARGRVRIVLGAHQFSQFRGGEVLVTEMTRPDFLPIMRRASAIITDEGGITSHAAIVARELGIPCIVGVKQATRWLKNGNLVAVDASQGTVTRLR